MGSRTWRKENRESAYIHKLIYIYTESLFLLFLRRRRTTVWGSSFTASCVVVASHALLSVVLVSSAPSIVDPNSGASFSVGL